MNVADRLDRESRRITKIIDDDMIYAKGGDSLIKLGKLLDAAMEHISKLEDINLKLAVKMEGKEVKKPQIKPVSEELLVGIIMDASELKRSHAQRVAVAINKELVRT